MKTITGKLVFKGEGATWEEAAEACAKQIEGAEKLMGVKADEVGLSRDDFDAEDHPLNGKEHLDVSVVGDVVSVTIG